jgi:MYXO-CTERM domain-containing protein
MIASRSRVWWHRCSAAGVLVALASCSSNSFTPEPFEDVEPGAVSGELEVYIADYEDGTTETRYMLKNAAGEETKLLFAQEPKITPGSRIHVWGGPSRDGSLRVDQYKVSARSTADLETQAQPVINPTPRAPRHVCPVLVETGGTGTITVDSINNQFHTGPKSVNQFYIENSYGMDSLTGKTYGPTPYPMTTCDTSGLSKKVKSDILAADATSASCKQWSFVMVGKVSACSWGGLAQVGNPTSPKSDTWYNNSIGCVVTVQEPGHNYGMNHSSSMTCTGGAPIADDMTSCTHSEYGDRFDPMGGGCRHMNGYQKWYQNWMQKCNGVKTANSGTFHIMPLEKACNGLQTLELMFPGGKTRLFNRPAGGGGSAGMDTLTSWYLEYRTPIGSFDVGMTPQVLVHVGPDASVTSKGGGPHMWLVDASATAAPGKLGSNPGMVAGGTFSDPAGGLTVTVMSMDADKAVVNVQYAAGTGGATCVDGTMFAPPGDEMCIPPVSTPPDGGWPDTGTGGKGGTGGTGGKDGGSGTAGTGGTAAGAGGVGGTAGTGGGAAGKAGSGGTAGTGGATGGAAGTGTGGATGGAGGVTGGAGGATGGTGGATGGTGGTGGATKGTGGATGGAGGATGGSGGGETGGTRPPPTTGGDGDPPDGCGCRIASPSSSGKLAGLFGLGLGAVFASRRRRRRA